MDLFDRRILAVLKDGKPRELAQLLSGVSFSRNTVRLHLARPEEQGLVERQKRLHEGPGRPVFTYSLSPGVRQASSVLIDSYSDMVVLTFEKLQHLCRHEKGSLAVQARKPPYAV